MIATARYTPLSQLIVLVCDLENVQVFAFEKFFNGIMRITKLSVHISGYKS